MLFTLSNLYFSRGTTCWTNGLLTSGQLGFHFSTDWKNPCWAWDSPCAVLMETTPEFPAASPWQQFSVAHFIERHFLFFVLVVAVNTYNHSWAQNPLTAHENFSLDPKDASTQHLRSYLLCSPCETSGALSGTPWFSMSWPMLCVQAYSCY